MRIGLLLGAAGLVGLSMAATASDASACGGCFHGPSQNGDVITDHRMVFRVTPQATTLYDEIEYTGNPKDFAWVLPIHGAVTVGLSSDLLFSALDQATQTTILSPNLPPCASCSCANAPTAGAGSSSGGGTLAADAGAVNVIGQQTVGPYDTVQLQSTDPMALENWLTANGYTIPAAVQPVITAYVNEGFDFLVLKLQPGQGVSAMRPVRVTAAGAALSLPLRMVAAGTGATVGITLWVIGDGRYEAQNFQNFIIDPAELTWDWKASTSNYTTLQAAKEASLSNAAWQTESSMQISSYQVQNNVMYAPNDYLPVPANDAGSPGETAEQVRQDDLSTIFPGGTTDIWVTRMRSDLSHAALANDLVLQASSDQTQLSNRYQVNKSLNAPTCPAVPNPCPPCGAGGGSPFGPQPTPPYGSPFGNGSTGSGSGSGSGHSGCSTAPEDRGGSGIELVLAGLAALVVFGKRRGRKS